MQIFYNIPLSLSSNNPFTNWIWYLQWVASEANATSPLPVKSSAILNDFLKVAMQLNSIELQLCFLSPREPISLKPNIVKIKIFTKKIFRCLASKNSIFDMEASEPMWVNPNDIEYGVNLLRLEDINIIVIV